MWGHSWPIGREGRGVSDRPDATESARLLRQRIEMGARDLVLDSITSEEALRLVESALRSRTMPAGPRSTSRPPATSGPPATSRPRATSKPPAASRPPATSGAAPDRAEAPRPAVNRTLPVVLPDGYDEVRALAMGCTACGLSESRTQVVFSDGHPTARLMVVGEAPGANEDKTGVPFVGAAGQFLDLLLATVGLSRAETVYIANVLKCRPPGNRDPQPAEIEACSPFLKKQIELVGPDALLAVGSFSGRLLTGQEKSSLGRLRGTVHSYEGVPLVVTYHPAALLRNSNWTRSFWEDLQLLRGVLDGA